MNSQNNTEPDPNYNCSIESLRDRFGDTHQVVTSSTLTQFVRERQDSGGVDEVHFEVSA